MATEVIYEEAVPVGLMMSSANAGGPSPGLIYAEAVPVDVGGGPPGDIPVMFTVQQPAWTCRPAGDVHLTMQSDSEAVSGYGLVSRSVGDNGNSSYR
jgi:hypothetical protein